MLNVVPATPTAGLQLTSIKLSLDKIVVPASFTDPATRDEELMATMRLGLAMSNNSFLDEDGL
jgi:hypothetical protein